MRNLGRFFLIVVVFGMLAACAGDESGLKDIVGGQDADGNDASTSDVTSDAGADTTSDTTPDDTTNDDTADEDSTDEDSTDDDTTPASRDCRANEDCDSGEVCRVDRSSDPITMTCEDAGGGGGLGDACSDDADCASNLCVEDRCSQPCERPVDCSDDGSFICNPTEVQTDNSTTETINICQPRPPSQCSSDADCNSPERCMAIKGSTELAFECGAPNAGGEEVGGSCSGDTDCAQNLCLGDVCSGPCASTGDCSTGDDFACEITSVELGGGESDSAQVCAPPRACDRNAECRIGEVCRIDRASGETFCGDDNSGGGSLGDQCGQDSGCAENLCFDGRFSEFCTPTCASDSDCTRTGYHCEDTAVDDGSGGQNTIKICVAEDPDACSSNDDCRTGYRCAVVPNGADSGLETACIPAGGKAGGVGCAADNECASRVCLNDVCSDPCTNRSHCAGEQICRSNAISKNGLSGTFDMCEVLLDERCDQTGTCSDGVRMCNEIRQGSNDPDAREAFCGLTDPSAPEGLGGNCQSGDDCRSTFCMTGLSDDCSVVCTEDNQCGSGQECTPIQYNDETQLGNCMRGCVRNQDCTSLNFNDGGQTVDHVCGINVDQANTEVDQICFRRNSTASGKLGDSCAGDSAQCESGLCLINTLFDGRSCSSDSQCDSGQVCDVAPNGTMQCGDQTFACTRLCASAADCNGGAGNQLTSCNQDIRVSVGGGQVDTISACSAG